MMRKKEEEISQLSEPDFSFEGYTYANLLTWNLDEMVELIKGKIYKMNSPMRLHQKISGALFFKLYQFLEGKSCEVYDAPFDVRLPVKGKKNHQINTVVQPDICVICDPSKLDAAGCMGAPDLVVEILSKGNNRKELIYKYEVYEESGVLEYWVIQPEEQTLIIYTLIDGKFVPSRLFTTGDVVTSTCLPGFQLDLTYVLVQL